VHQKPQKILIIFCGQKKITSWQIFTVLGILSNQEFIRIAQVAERCKFQLKVETQASKHMSNIQAFYLKVSQKTLVSGLSPFGVEFAN
jgi:hypothetical protein